jgi:hypothetical protein
MMGGYENRMSSGPPTDSEWQAVAEMPECRQQWSYAVASIPCATLGGGGSQSVATSS